MSDHHLPASHTSNLASTITASLAGALNMLVLLVICFVVMPIMNKTVVEMEKNQKIVIEIQQTLNENQKDMVEYGKVIKRLNDALDAAAAKAKAIQDKKK